MEDSTSLDRVSLWLLKRSPGETLVIVSDPALPRTRAIRLLIDWVEHDQLPKSPQVRRIVLTPLEDLFLANVSQLENSTYRDSVGKLLWEYSSPEATEAPSKEGLMLAALRELEEKLYARGVVEVEELAR